MIRKVKQADKEQLDSIVRMQTQFTDDEKDVACELIAIAAANPDNKDYTIFVHEENTTVLGYVCIGLRPMTDAVYDLYWIVVSTEAAGKGIGGQLIAYAEQTVQQLGGRWLLIETASKESYSLTQNFYKKNGFELVASIPDFYSLGDGLMIFGKKFYQ